MLLSKAKDSAFWNTVRTHSSYKPFRDELAAMWETNCSSVIPACKYSEFIIYDKNGSRKEYENSYFLRRRQMNTAALLAMIYPDEERYIEYLSDVVWAILDEYVWVLPAHMPSFTENVVEHIDLFSSETGFALAEIDYILGDRLPKLIRSRIKTEIDRRIIKAYLNNTYWWEGCTNNWAAVCLCGVIGSFIYQKPELVGQLMPRIKKTVDSFLSGFSDEGICLEGFGYWNYGFGFFVCIADMLRDFTNGEVDFFSSQKVEAIAGFAQKMFLDGSVTVSFSDGGLSGRYNLGLLYYIKKMYPDTVSMLPRELSYTNDGCGRWCLHIRSILWFDDSLKPASPCQSHTEYMKNAGWLIKHTPCYSFAAKGGANSEPHNHNDLGSFIVAKDGRQLLTDPGSGVYTREYFSRHRYEDFLASSRGHSVPIINGKYQVEGGKHYASTSYDNEVFKIEFEKGYDIESLSSLSRRFEFSDRYIILHDEFTYDGILESFTERFITSYKPEITNNSVKIESILLNPMPEHIASLVINEVNYYNRKYYCIDYILNPDVREFTMKISIE